MTVKELKEILDACNDNAEILIHFGVATVSGIDSINDSQVWADSDGTRVIIDPTFGMEE